MMPFDYSKLAGKITERYGTRGSFATAMGFSSRTMSLKMSGKVPWKQTEIARACSLLSVSDREIPSYFFAEKVQRK